MAIEEGNNLTFLTKSETSGKIKSTGKEKEQTL